MTWQDYWRLVRWWIASGLILRGIRLLRDDPSSQTLQIGIKFIGSLAEDGDNFDRMLKREMEKR